MSGRTSAAGIIRATRASDAATFQSASKEPSVPADMPADTPDDLAAAIDQRALDEVALSRAEYAQIVELLGRAPNPVELGLFGAMWSEHCGYKNSRPLLKRFPTSSPRILVKAGEENAGAVDIGDGLAVVMKIESHNHPSAIEPYQGAATGVGGIVRDIFTMGARPVALLDSLRFGPLNEPRNRYLFAGIVGGIGGYGRSEERRVGEEWRAAVSPGQWRKKC